MDISNYGYTDCGGANPFNFGQRRTPNFFSGPAVVYKMSMIMTDQERIRHIQEAAKKYVSRNKCVDASLITMINQAKASSVANPTTVSAVVNQGGCGTNAVVTGGGAGGEYFGILQVAQGCAICPDTAPADTGVTPQIVLPVPCIDMTKPPFAQQDVTNFYKEPCTNPGKRDYFPAPIYDGPGCTYTRITTPSG